MNNNYADFNSKRFLVILLLICLVFFIIVAKAFQYLPDSSPNDGVIVQRTQAGNSYSSNNTVESSAQEEPVVKEDNSLEAAEEVKKQKTLNITLPKADDTSELEDINEDLPQEAKAANSEQTAQTAVEITPEEKVIRILIASNKYKTEKQYVKALEELQKIPSVTSDVNAIARSYEEIASIYAIVKRYGTALSYAQRAYNMSPSSSREMLLARIYYKTGDIDKATKRINNVLQRDFSDDR